MNLKMKLTLIYTVLLATVGIGTAHAGITSASLSNFTIPSETLNTVGSPSGTTVQFTLDAGGNIELDIFNLRDISDQPSGANQVAGLQLNGALAGANTIFWNGLWPIGGDIGRKNGLFEFIVSYTSSGVTTSFIIPTFLHITSVDIHNHSATPSFDSNGQPAFPFLISYALAKDSHVTVKIKDSGANVVRTLRSNDPEFSEAISTITLKWNGLNDNNRPVGLGIYTVTIDATDPVTGDAATTRTLTATVQSLANLEADPKQVFESNFIVFPNPIRNGQATVEAIAVRNHARVSFKIYSIAGDLVREESFDNVATADLVSFTWNADNKAGRKVGRGLYYVEAREDDSDGTLQNIKKVAVIK
jgi:flagellar hook assembly protein FlgD